MVAPKSLITACVLGLASFAAAAPPTPENPNQLGNNGNGNGNGNGNKPQGLPGTPPPANPTQLGSSGAQTFSSGGGGCWSFDYNYLGCANSGTSCSSKTVSRYSPESGPGYITGNGGTLQVRLWGPFQNSNYDLYIEQYINGQWTVIKQSAQSSEWKEQVSFTTQPGAYYRFRAYWRSGSGYYTLSWKQ
jgi:hypothetical protein